MPSPVVGVPCTTVMGCCAVAQEGVTVVRGVFLGLFEVPDSVPAAIFVHKLGFGTLAGALRSVL